MDTKTPLIDFHTHTRNSFDGKDSAERMAARAREIGLQTLALTDHCEINGFFSEGYTTLIPKAFEDAQRAKQETKDVEVLAGIEIGQPNTNYELTERILSARPYDFVLVSLHNLPNMKDFYYLSYTPESAKFLLDRYFDELIRIVQWGNFDSAAHLTYPLRYITGEFGIAVDLAPYQEKLDVILSLLVQNGKALEINTSGYRQKLGNSVPDVSIVRRFRELGGRYLTVGSDAHCAADLGKGIREGVQVARDAGFSNLTIFRGRKPELIEI